MRADMRSAGLTRVCACVAVAAATLAAAVSAQGRSDWLDPYRGPVSRLIAAATYDDSAWRRLAELTDTFGSRLSGSENLTRAITWAADTMKADGLEHVRTEPVMVPHWIRGHESAEIVGAVPRPLAVLGLGGTVSTPPGGIEGELLVVSNFDDLRDRAASVRGRIVLFDVPFSTYNETMAYRTGGASAAARHGAAAVLMRSVGPPGLRTPHTGSVQYAADTVRIPALAVATEDADALVRLGAGGRPVRVRVVTGGRYETDAPSANVVAEIRGREKPDEVVLLGGHLDSWDVGTGASDDGVGCIVTWEAVRLMKRLGLRPRRTVRLVLWTNEENGLRGADAYAARYGRSAGDHVFALEADLGVFEPASLAFTGSISARMTLAQIGTLLAPLGLSEIGPGGGGADIDPIAMAGKVPAMAYLGDPSRYFVVHHTQADTVDRIAPAEVSKAAAAIAAVTWVVAEMPERLAK